MIVETPYPLKRYFWRRIVPGLAIFLTLVVGLTIFGARHLAETLYIENAQRRAEVIARAVAHTAPEGWQAIIVEHRRPEEVAAAVYDKLREEFDHEIEELQLDLLKVYSPNGRLLYATGEPPSTQIETGLGLRNTVAFLQPQLIDKTDQPKPEYEIYVPLLDKDGQLLAVFELYEGTDQLNAVLSRAAGPAAVPAGLFLVLIVTLGLIVGRAQKHIDQRAREVLALTRKLGSFVSTSAVDAARDSAGGDIPSERVRLTLFYSDARDFTGYSESNPPERVVWFLNELMTIQVNTVRRHGGDVDKMIGDALLARFKGPDAEANAVLAARDVQGELKAANLPRPVGIGIYSGDVISGAIGSPDRRDFTVIGDGVNVAARLCSAAGAGQIVVDTATLEKATDEGFGPEEALSVKGRAEPVRARRWP